MGNLGINLLFKAWWLLYIPLAATLKKLYILPIENIYVFRVILRINSNCFPAQLIV
jgi:hypothetical protein